MSVIGKSWFVYLGCLALAVPQSSFAQSPSTFIPVTPCRVLDTRNPTGPLGGPAFGSASSRSFPIPSSSCGIPLNASAYSINIGVLPLTSSFAYLSIWPTGQSQPTTATMSSPSGQIVGNAAIVPAGTGGAVSVYVTDPANVIIDINGYFAPLTNSGSQSTAVGVGASSRGSENTSVGFNSLQVNDTGTANTAVGASALSGNTSGNNNVGLGYGALAFNASGSANTALGAQSLLNDLIGSNNTGVGLSSLWSLATGSNNVAVGAASIYNNTSGGNNTALGQSALYNAIDGSGNIAIGFQAGYLVTNGSYNIEIGTEGVSTDSNAIRIGSIGDQTSTFIAGINGVNISSGSAVLINSNGQLGTMQSSARYKRDVHDMGSVSDGLMKLRPVTFHYQDAPDCLQYGLIGEEVASAYPDLVVYGADHKVESVQYHELPALLLNELQKQHKTIQSQATQLEEAHQEIEGQRERISSLEKRLLTLEAALPSLRDTRKTPQ